MSVDQDTVNKYDNQIAMMIAKIDEARQRGQAEDAAHWASCLESLERSRCIRLMPEMGLQ